ncbi:hypothetical protein ABK905_20890 [Acerihabitans sp. KWT182]|uniref:Uncharacterized protein n=1 Tax=Acerihabitans sp. KWT182 TaxID=3157919 RepID=A0AAU7Q790_9GAMM
MLEIIRNPSQVRTFSDMLRVEPGKLVRFTRLEDSKVSHLMISLGNGRFAGMNNKALESSLSNEKRILIAEQLGTFKEDVLRTFDKRHSLLVEKGDFHPSHAPTKSLMDAAAEMIDKVHYEKSSTRFALEVLVAAKKLVPQQADALERLATLMTGKLDGEKISLVKLNKFLLIEKIYYS